MWINTTRFGRIDVDAADLLTFQSGLPGLEQCREWALLADAENDALGWLQSTTRDDVAIAVVSPRRFIPQYQVRIPRSELTPLRLHDIRQAQLVVVLLEVGGQHRPRDPQQGIVASTRVEHTVHLSVRGCGGDVGRRRW